MDSVLFVDKTIFNLSRDTKKAAPGRSRSGAAFLVSLERLKMVFLGVIVIPYRIRFGVRNVDFGSAGVFWVTAVTHALPWLPGTELFCAILGLSMQRPFAP